MKIIHTADQHLDSSMTKNFNTEKARERKKELLRTFIRMVEYAVEEGVEAILLSGDLFDTADVHVTERRAVEKVIRDNPSITFFYLKGNHDMNSFLTNLDDIPENLKLFSETWQSYELGDTIVITGVELTANNKDTISSSLILAADKFNIVMLHGQQGEYKSKDKAENISIRDYRNKNIDYLALGHIHEYQKDAIDSRGTWCYPGCLEGRGFDECGDHGFVLIDVDEHRKTADYRYVSFAYRKIYEVNVDVTGLEDTLSVIGKINAQLDGKYDKKDILKIILKGEVSLDSERDVEYISKNYESEYFYVKVCDETKMYVDYNSYALDESLKGEFVRTVMDAEDMDEQQKARVIQLGISLLKGEKA